MQVSAQALFTPNYQEFTINGVAVKLIFPDNYGGYLDWCMAYQDNGFITTSSL